MKLTIFILILISISSCATKKETGVEYSIDSSTQDTIKYTPLEKGFYRSSDGKMYIKTRSLIKPPEKYGPPFYRPIPDIDVESYKLLCSAGWYAKDKNHVYMVHGSTDGEHIWILDTANANTFECIQYRWGKDDRHVFNNGKILTGLDPEELEILYIKNHPYGKNYFEAVKDKDQVYFDRKEVINVDAPSFEYHETSDSIHYRDKNWLYEDQYFSEMDSKYRIKR